MLSNFLAKKIYFDSGDTKRVSKPAVLIATAGMAIGIAVMIVSVSVVLGFKSSIREKVIGFGSHIVVRNFSSLNDNRQMPVAADSAFLKKLEEAPEVANVQRYAIAQGILKTDSDFLGVVFKGVAEEYDTLFLHDNIVEGRIPHFSDKKSSNAIVVSRSIADKLHLSVGTRLFAYFLAEEGVKTRRFTVEGIYNTNLSKYDEVMVFSDLRTVQRINMWREDRVSGVEILVKDIAKIDTTARWMIHNVHRTTDRYGERYTSSTMYEINPQIFAWLELLDLNVWLIFALMIAVATVTIISGLLIVILERVNMIGILKALGARNAMIRHTFLWFGLFIISRAVLIGNILGLALCLFQKYTGLISLDPQNYYVSTVQVEINIPVILAINIAAILFSVVILILPTMLVSHISPTKSMKFGE